MHRCSPIGHQRGDKDTVEEETGEAERAWAEHGLGWLTGCAIIGLQQKRKNEDGAINMQLGVSYANKIGRDMGMAEEILAVVSKD